LKIINFEIDYQDPLIDLTVQEDNNSWSAKTIRDHFMKYFNTIGSVSWQNEAKKKLLIKEMWERMLSLRNDNICTI